MTNRPITAGSWLMVEYTAASQWYNACLTIAAGWLKTGGRVSYSAYAWPPENVRSQLNLLGLKVEELEKVDRLRIWDWYTATLGRKSREKLSVDSLKVADLSILFSREVMAGHPALERQPYGPEWLRIADNGSTMRKPGWNSDSLETFQVRHPRNQWQSLLSSKAYTAVGPMSNWRQQLMGSLTSNLTRPATRLKKLMRIKTLRNVGFDGRWQSRDH